MLRTSKLLIDQECPMCNLYGKCFYKANLITKDTLAPFQHFDKTNKHIDFELARNKIALYNQQTNLTIYGIDALIHVVSHNKLWLNKILNSTIIYFVLAQLYNFISYNRKVIFPVRTADKQACEPDLKKSYRIAFIIITAMITAYMLTAYSNLLFHRLGITTHPSFEYLIAFSQIIWQGTFLYLLTDKLSYDYLGNMSTISLGGSILLIVPLLINYLIPLSSIALILSFGSIVTLMLLEHIRRVKILELPSVTTISWIVFRLLIVLIIIL